MMVEPGFATKPAVLILPIAGNRDKNHARSSARIPKRLCYFVTIHAGQSDVEQYRFGLVLRRQFNRIAAGVRCFDFMTHCAQQHCQGIGTLTMIVNHEQSPTR